MRTAHAAASEWPCGMRMYACEYADVCARLICGYAYSETYVDA
jgi:hypothetical protein